MLLLHLEDSNCPNICIKKKKWNIFQITTSQDVHYSDYVKSYIYIYIYIKNSMVSVYALSRDLQVFPIADFCVSLQNKMLFINGETLNVSLKIS